MIDTITDIRADSIATSMLLICVSTEFFVLPASNVREVVRYQTITRVPGAPASLPGIINHHGAIVPVADLRQIMQLPSLEISRDSRLVICHHEMADLAFLVDKVIDLVAFSDEQIEPVPPSHDTSRAPLLNGIVRHDHHLISLIDLQQVIVTLVDWT